jgi:hypothetical protein
MGMATDALFGYLVAVKTDYLTLVCDRTVVSDNTVAVIGENTGRSLSLAKTQVICDALGHCAMRVPGMLGVDVCGRTSLGTLCAAMRICALPRRQTSEGRRSRLRVWFVHAIACLM